MGDAAKKDSKTQLYVSNLPSGASSKRLEDAFAPFGEITDAFIPHRGSRFGFVDFKEPDAATKALEEMANKPLDETASKAHPSDMIGVIRAKERPAQKEKKVVEKKDEKKAEKDDKKEAPKGGRKGKKEGPGPAEEKAQSRKKPAGGEEAPKDRAPRLYKKSIDAVADKLFKALSEADWEAAGSCFAPEAECYSPQRKGARSQKFEEFKKTMGGMIGLLGKPQYLNVRRLYGPDSVTEQHTTKFAEKEATKVEAEACVLLRLNPAGLIVRMDEYLDPTAVLKAVQTASKK